MNQQSIGIEICCNPMECYTKCKQHTCKIKSVICGRQEEQIKRFFKAEQNAIDLIYNIMTKWDLSADDVIFHSDVKKTECPYFTKKLHNITSGKDFLQVFNRL